MYLTPQSRLTDLIGGVVIKEVYDGQQCHFMAALGAVLVLKECHCHACCEGIAAARRHLQTGSTLTSLLSLPVACMSPALPCPALPYRQMCPVKMSNGGAQILCLVESMVELRYCVW